MQVFQVSFLQSVIHFLRNAGDFKRTHPLPSAFVVYVHTEIILFS